MGEAGADLKQQQQHMVWLSMLNFLTMLWVKLPVLNIIHPQINKFATGVENVTFYLFIFELIVKLCSNHFSH